MGVNRFLYKTFKKIKEMITSTQVLVHYDPKKPMTLATDTIPHGLRSVLFHTMPEGPEKPLAFASRTIGFTEKKYLQIDNEALGILPFNRSPTASFHISP